MTASKYEVFIKVAELGGLTRAAAALGCTQSNVSHIINALEDEFGFPLFTRGRGGAKLTPDGQRVLPAVRAVVASTERLAQTVASLRGLDSGLVRIGAFSSVAVHWLPGMIKAFTEDYPNIEIGLSNGDYHDVEQWLSDGSIDLGFVTLPCSSDCKCIPLLEDRLLLVVPKTHRLAGRTECPITELEGENFISLLESSDQDMRKVLLRAGVNANIRYVTKDDYAMIAMVENGLGVSIMPELLLRGQSGGVAVRPLDPPSSRILAMALPAGERTGPAARRFAEFAVDWVGKNA